MLAPLDVIPFVNQIAVIPLRDASAILEADTIMQAHHDSSVRRTAARKRIPAG